MQLSWEFVRGCGAAAGPDRKPNRALTLLCCGSQALETAIPDRLSDVLGRNGVLARKIGDRTRNACDAVERPRGKLALRARVGEQSHRGVVERAVAAHRVTGNLGVAAQRRSREARALPFTRRDDPRANSRRRVGAVI